MKHHDDRNNAQDRGTYVDTCFNALIKLHPDQKFTALFRRITFWFIFGWATAAAASVPTRSEMLQEARTQAFQEAEMRLEKAAAACSSPNRDLGYLTISYVKPRVVPPMVVDRTIGISDETFTCIASRFEEYGSVTFDKNAAAGTAYYSARIPVGSALPIPPDWLREWISALATHNAETLRELKARLPSNWTIDEAGCLSSFNGEGVDRERQKVLGTLGALKVSRYWNQHLRRLLGVRAHLLEVYALEANESVVFAYIPTEVSTDANVSHRTQLCIDFAQSNIHAELRINSDLGECMPKGTVDALVSPRLSFPQDTTYRTASANEDFACATTSAGHVRCCNAPPNLEQSLSSLEGCTSVLVSRANFVCALCDGSARCADERGKTFKIAGITQLAHKANRICGLSTNGDARCWDSSGTSAEVPELKQSSRLAGSPHRQLLCGVHLGLNDHATITCSGGATIHPGPHFNSTTPFIVHDRICIGRESHFACFDEMGQPRQPRLPLQQPSLPYAEFGAYACGVNRSMRLECSPRANQLQPKLLDLPGPIRTLTAGDGVCGIDLRGSAECWVPHFSR